MLIKILLDPAFAEKSYKDFQVDNRHEVYAEVTSVKASESSHEFYLKECPIETNAFEGLPEISVLTVYPESASLFCEWNKPDEDVMTYISLKVEVQECDRFPPLRSDAHSGLG
jgi:hypothetical protein